MLSSTAKNDDVKAIQQIRTNLIHLEANLGSKCQFFM